eukprot:TRINITY_DN4242_c0_g1_i5.p1 TRINITY_DN4242_c0_g1~~TRINITY_DN4242_c0_g1_i5.p1  ORF type:complete len:153 (+),score=33.25 TRINITY_DN4242_c0_g1_i5:85-543(+)
MEGSIVHPKEETLLSFFFWQILSIVVIVIVAFQLVKRLRKNKYQVVEEVLEQTPFKALEVSVTPPPVNEKKFFTREEVAKHNKKTDCWIVVKNEVFDVTKYIPLHTGGLAILNNAGGDSTTGFFGDQHPETAQDILRKYYIGDLVPETKKTV